MKKITALIAAAALAVSMYPQAMAELIVESEGSSDQKLEWGTEEPTQTPEPTAAPEQSPEPTEEPEPTHTPEPTETPEASATPTVAPTKEPSVGGGGSSSGSAKPSPTAAPTAEPTASPTAAPEAEVSAAEVFDDVSEDAWFCGDVTYVYENNIMSGVADGVFSPNTGITRAMMITIIHRTAGAPDASGGAFSDVDESGWYAKAVAWGAENKIVTGTGEGMFSPDAFITREQLAVMLYNYEKASGEAEILADISAFSDSGDVSVWARDAMCWAYANGLISGKSETTLAPKDGATRAEAAAIIRRFLVK